jgi:hypothetical protein
VAPAGDDSKQPAKSGSNGKAPRPTSAGARADDGGPPSDGSEIPFADKVDGLLRWAASKNKKGPIRRRVQVFVYWPQTEWPGMLERWPHFADEYGGDHDTHRHMLEDMLSRHAEEPGITVAVASLTVDGLLAYADVQEVDAASSETRAAYAAELGRDKKAEIWPPPKRRARCWCGSRKPYEECCRVA